MAPQRRKSAIQLASSEANLLQQAPLQAQASLEVKPRQEEHQEQAYSVQRLELLQLVERLEQNLPQLLHLEEPQDPNPVFLVQVLQEHLGLLDLVYLDQRQGLRQVLVQAYLDQKQEL